MSAAQILVVPVRQGNNSTIPKIAGLHSLVLTPHNGDMCFDNS